jgi:ABC-type nitrate/sulfonate/bicarbonate transport system permease component
LSAGSSSQNLPASPIRQSVETEIGAAVGLSVGVLLGVVVGLVDGAADGAGVGTESLQKIPSVGATFLAGLSIFLQVLVSLQSLFFSLYVA